MREKSIASKHSSSNLASDFFNFSDLESDYLRLQRELQLSYTKARVRSLKKSLEVLKIALNETARIIQVEEVDQHELLASEYFLDPFAVLVHVMLTIRKFAENSQTIPQILSIDRERFSHIVDLLFKLKFLMERRVA